MKITSIGPYHVVRELPRQRHARLFLARDAQQERELVIKLLNSVEYTDPTIRARFKLEMQLLESLGNQAILAADDFGEQDGQLYIATRWMPGGSLADSLQYGPLPLTEAARILTQLAPALDAAHSLGIWHGDIKPANILFDENDLPVLADFGMLSLLRAMVRPEQDVLLGPPAYISPEAAQVGLQTGDPFTAEGVGRASDLYMLSVVLFEMLTGQTPFTARTPLGMAVQHISQPPPSVCSLRAELSPDWEDVLSIALAKDPAQRYPSAIELAAAVEAVMTQPRVEAARPGQGERRASRQAETLPVRVSQQQGDFKSKVGEPIVQAVRSKPTSSWKRGLVVIFLIGVLAVAGLLAVDHQGGLMGFWPIQPGQVVTVSPTVNQATSEVRLIADLLPSETAARFTPTLPTTQTPLSATWTNVPTSAPSQTMNPATAVPPTTYEVQYNDTLFTVASQFHVDMAEMLGMNSMSCDSRLAVGKPIIIPPAYPYRPVIAQHEISVRNFNQLSLEHIVDCTAHVAALEFSPDGELLAVAEDEYIYLWNVGDWKPFLRLKGHLSDVTSLNFSPDGLLLASGSYDNTIKLWHVSDGSLVTTLKGHGSQITAVAFHPGGQQLVSTSRDYTARLWQVDGTQLHVFSGFPTFSAAYAPDGQTLAIGYADSVRFYQLRDLSESGRLPSADVVSHLVYSPDGQLLASSSDLWHIREGRQIYHLQSSGDSPLFSSDGLVLFTGRKIWKVANGTLIGMMESPLPESPRTGDVWDALAISPDQGRLAWGTPDGLFIFSLPSSVVDEGDTSSQLHVVGNGDTIYNLSSDYQVELQKLLSLNGITCNSPIFEGQHLWIPDNAALSLDQSQLQPIQASNAEQLSTLRSFSMGCSLTNSDLYFSADSQKLVSGSSLWNVPSGSIEIQSTLVPLTFDGSPDPNLPSPLLVISPDQATLAVRAGREIQLWDIATKRLVRKLVGHQDVVTSLVYSADGAMLVSGSGTGEQKIIFWDVQDGTQIKSLDGWTVFKLSFTADGQYLIGEGDDAVRIWRMSDNRLVSTLQGVIGDIAYSPDGSLLAFTSCSEKVGAGCVKELVSLYKVADGDVLWSVEGFTDDISGIRFSPDGQIIASSAGNGILLINTLDGQVKHRLYEAGNLVNVLDMTFSADGSLLFSTWVNMAVRIWNTQDGSLVHTLNNLTIERMAFSPDQRMWTVLARNIITLWGIR